MNLVVVGGGFSGVSVAVQVARYAPQPVRITIVEPEAQLGRGLAYSTPDPDHRLNGPFFTHSVDPLDTNDGDRWAQRNNLLEEDPDAQCATGIFPRRRDFARYLADAVAVHAAANPSRSSIKHQRNRVVAIERGATGLLVQLDDGTALPADQVVLAIGNPPPRLPAMLQAWADHPALLGSPWQPGGLRGIDADARVTVMGSSLTAADVLATLMRQQHRGPITVFSRRGLRPREQRPPDPNAPASPAASWLVDRINGQVPEFLAAVLRSKPGARELTRAVRQEIAACVARGEAWQAAFDGLRDVVWQVWPHLPVVEQRRFLRHLRPWYDVHRFRMSPPTTTLIDPAVARGQIRFMAARLDRIASAPAEEAAGLQVSVIDRQEQTLTLATDAFVNCSGLDLTGRPRPGSLPARLLADGLLQPNPNGLGFLVAPGSNEVLAADGRPVTGLRLVGPPSAGCYGDPLGAMFIAVQIRRMLPTLWPATETAQH